jgi:hypothetical protein
LPDAGFPLKVADMTAQHHIRDCPQCRFFRRAALVLALLALLAWLVRW